MINVGCCGFPVARAKYFEKFSVVEPQSTFYDFVKPETAHKWRTQTPKNFEFIIKAPQFITHPSTSPTYRRAKHLAEFNVMHLGNFQPTKDVFTCYRKTHELAKILDTRILIFQSPPSFKPDEKNIKNMKKFFKKIQRKDMILGWESRGKWLAQEIKHICEELDLLDVVDPFIRDPLSGRIFYFRLHGGKGYRHKFSDDELASLAKKIARLSIKDGYVMFNNINMFKDAQRFQNFLVRS